MDDLTKSLCVIYRTQPIVCMSDINEEYMQYKNVLTG